MAWVFLIASLVVPLIIGFAAARNKAGWIVWGLTLVCAAASLFLYRKAGQAHGWDSLGWAMWIYLVTLPAILGLLVGAAFGGWARKRAERHGAPGEGGS